MVLLLKRKGGLRQAKLLETSCLFFTELKLKIIFWEWVFNQLINMPAPHIRVLGFTSWLQLQTPVPWYTLGGSR